MTIAFGSVGAQAVGTTTLSVPYPADIGAGDLLLLCIANKTPPSSPQRPGSEWSFITGSKATGGAGAPGPDSGEVYATVYSKVADGLETGSCTLNIPDGSSACAQMLRYTKDSSKGWLCAATGGADNVAGTSFTVTGAVDPGLEAGDMVVAVAAMNTDARSYSGHGLSAPGATVGAGVERVETDTNKGDDCALNVSEHAISAGTSTSVPVFTMSANASTGNQNAGAAVLLRLRAVPLAGSRTMKWSSLYRTYAGDPWGPSATAGSSGLNDVLYTVGDAPTVDDGAAVFDGVDDRMGTNVGMAVLLAEGKGTIAGLIWVDAFDVAPSGNFTNDPGVLKNNAPGALIGLSATTVGLTAYVTIAGVPYSVSALPAANAWVPFRLRLDGATLGLTLGNGTEQVVVLPSAFVPPWQAMILGVGIPKYLKHRLRELGTMRESMSDADWTTYGQGLQAEYGLTLGF